MTRIFTQEFWKSAFIDICVSIVSTGLLGAGTLLFQNSKWMIFTGIALGIFLSLKLTINYVKWIEKKKFKYRTSRHHDMIHDSRNLMVELMAPKEDEIPNSKPGQQPVSLTGPIEDYTGKIEKILNSAISMFQELVPGGTNVWACLRERRNDDNYYTVVRAGNYHRGREHKSQPLHKNSDTIRSLKESFRISKTCVYITGSDQPGWKLQENDALGEDKSVLMGAILSKSWNGTDFDKIKLNWILYINSDKKNTFNDSHVNLMKCCIDNLSSILNMLIRRNYIDYTFNYERNSFVSNSKSKLRKLG